MIDALKSDYVVMARIKGVPETPNDLDGHQLITYGMKRHPYEASNWILTLGRKEGDSRKSSVPALNVSPKSAMRAP